MGVEAGCMEVYKAEKGTFRVEDLFCRSAPERSHRCKYQQRLLTACRCSQYVNLPVWSFSAYLRLLGH